MTETGSDPYLVHQWVLAGIASAAARFIPVPFVDDIVRVRARQFAVARTLAAHDYDYPSKEIAAVYGGESDGFIAGLFKSIVRAPLKLALYPIRKLVRLFGSVRGVPLDLMQTILTARTLERCIDRGMFHPSTNPPERQSEAEEFAAAFAEAFDGIDWLTVKSLMSDTMQQVKHWGAATTELAREVFSRDQVDPDKMSAEPLANDSEIQRGAAQVEAMLERPETLQLMATFDERFDSSLKEARS